MTPASFHKNPDADLDYSQEWADWLAPVADTISSSTWEVEAGITAGAESMTATSATIWLSGGTPGEVYLVTNAIVTAAGRTDSRSFTITIRQPMAT